MDAISNKIAGDLGDALLTHGDQVKLQNNILYVVGLALFCDYLLLTLCVPILPNLLGESFNPFLISLVFASKPAFQFIANPFMGSIVDKHGPKQPLLLGVLVLALSTFLFAYGASLRNLDIAYAILISARSVQGIASATTMSAGMTMLALTHPESIRGTAMGAAMVGVALGTLIGPPIGGILSHFTNYWVPFVIVGCVLVLNLLLQLVVLSDIFSFLGCNTVHYIDEEEQKEFRSASIDPTTTYDSNEHSISLAVPIDSQQQHAWCGCNQYQLILMIRDQHIGLVALVSVAGNATIGMIEPLVPIYLRNQFNENVLYQGLIFACATFSYLLFTPIAGTLSDQYEKRKCLCFGIFVTAVGLAMFMLSGSSLVTVCFSLVFIGGGMSFIDTPVLPYLSELIAVCSSNMLL